MASMMELSIPEGRSALGFLSRSRYQHPLQHQDVCKEDGYVYRDGVKAFKWFDYISPECSDTGLRVFPGALADIKRIEALYWRAMEQRNQHYAEGWPKFVAEFAEKKQAVFIPKDPELNYTHFLYEYSTWAGEGSIREIGWKKGDPPVDACPDLGKRYRQFIWTRGQQLGSRVGRIKAVLGRAFEKALPTTLPWAKTEEENHTRQQKIGQMIGRMHRIQINGRYYWYQFTSSKYGGSFWAPHYWPDSELSETNLDQD